MSHRARNAFLIIAIVAVIFSLPLSAFAQQTSNTSNTDTSKAVVPQRVSSEQSQATAYRQGVEKTGTAPSAKNSGVQALACSAGQLLSNVISGAISSAISSLSSKPEDAKNEVTTVPTSNTTLQDKAEITKNAEIGFTIPFTNVYAGVSWNSIAYCIVNTMIEYIADSTIAWANSGFNGNPAFIDNPEQFFTDLADQEAGAFIQDFAKNAAGINVCQPFRVSIAIGLSDSYGNRNNFARQSSCTLQQAVGNMQSFVNGNFSEGGWKGWFALTQQPQNNPIGLKLMADEELYRRISVQNNTATLELGLNRGFLSFKKCDNPDKPTDCHTTTPGLVIQTELEKTMGLPKDRLVLAQKFDQVVEALVNNLIKVALNEALGSGQQQR